MRRTDGKEEGRGRKRKSERKVESLWRRKEKGGKKRNRGGIEKGKGGRGRREGGMPTSI